jgi:hypothetical protein
MSTKHNNDFSLSLLRNKVLIVGSGKSATEIKSWDLTGWSLLTINHAHRIRPDWEFAGYSPDMPKDRRPIKSSNHQYLFSAMSGPTSTFESLSASDQRSYNNAMSHWKRQIDTMFFAASYWALTYLKPSFIGYMGCDMNYTVQNDATHFYGMGLDTGNDKQPDPLKYFESKQMSLGSCLADLAVDAESVGCTLVNFSTEETKLPYAKLRWMNQS